MAASLSERLARHRARRSRGEPTVSAWVCPWPFEADAAGAVLGGTVVAATGSSPNQLSKDWLHQWFGENRLQAILSARVHQQLAEALGVSIERAATVLSETPPADREPVIAQAQSKLSDRIATLIRWWVQTPQRSTRESITALDRNLTRVDADAELRCLIAIAEVCPPEDRPWLAIIPPSPLPEEPVAWLEDAAVRMEQLTETLPDWPALVAAPESVWQASSSAIASLPPAVVRLLGGLLEPLSSTTPSAAADVVAFYDLGTSLRSLLRGQGTPGPDLTSDLEPPPTSSEPGETPATTDTSSSGPVDTPTPEPPTKPVLAETPATASGSPERPAASLRPTSTATETPSSPVRPTDVLLERLEAEPTTAGQFVADARIDAGPGGRRVDVALHAAEVELAIEFDDAFAAPTLEAYRKARHKDLWLQRRGLLVMRILADDVDKRLEDLALQIRDVVRERRIRGRRR